VWEHRAKLDPKKNRCDSCSSPCFCSYTASVHTPLIKRSYGASSAAASAAAIVTPTKKRKKTIIQKKVVRKMSCCLCECMCNSRQIHLTCAVCKRTFCTNCEKEGKLLVTLYCTFCGMDVCDECTRTCRNCWGASQCCKCFLEHICDE
jgi:hypothetical protein